MQTNIIKIITYSHLDIYQWKRLHAALGRPHARLGFFIYKKLYFDAHTVGNKPPILQWFILDGESEKLRCCSRLSDVSLKAYLL
jgi:hypothetical protein